MSEPRGNQAVLRPIECPFCKGKRFDTLAKVITTMTFWRCRDCEGTWTIASQQASKTRP